MSYVPKAFKRKEDSSYKTIYLSNQIVNEIDKIAAEYNISFNNVVVSMIEDCLNGKTDKEENTL